MSCRLIREEALLPLPTVTELAMDSEEGKQLASGTAEMAKAGVDESAKLSGSYDDEETKAGQTDGVHSSSLAEFGDRVRVSSDRIMALC
jgi:hypothetical protein